MIFTSLSADLVVREVGGELIIHRPADQTYHALEPRAAAVFRAVDGRRDVASVAAVSGIDADVATTVLAELVERGLVSAPKGFDRRALLRRGGVVLAGAGIATIVAPTADAAASTAGPRFGIRSATNAALYITESATAGGLATMTIPSTAAEKRRATFVGSTALAPNAAQPNRISYQSLDRTGSYIRHAGEFIYVQGGSGSPFVQDATFEVVAALNGNSTMRSLRAVTSGYELFYVQRLSDTAGSQIKIVLSTTIVLNGAQGLASFFLQPNGPT